MKKRGVIYILTNPSFKEYVKIGFATDIEKRLKQLNRSETVPFAFRVYAIYDVESNLTDKELHKLIDRLNPDLRTIETFDGKKREKEFYEMSPEDAYELLSCIAKISGTQDRLKRMKPEGHEVLDEELANEARSEARRPPFNFIDCGIPEGSEIVFIEDDSVRPKVVDGRHIEWDGVVTSLSRLTQDLKGFDHPVQGTLWFTYEGKLLTKVREEHEMKGDA